MTVSLPIAREILTDAARAQVQAWDERFGTSPASSQTVNAKAQTEAFAKRDATGVEAVHDVMPTEQQIFEDFLFEAAATSTAPALQVLDFGCGDGRYLQQFLRSAEALRPRGRTLRVVAYEVSAEALRSFHAQEPKLQGSCHCHCAFERCRYAGTPRGTGEDRRAAEGGGKQSRGSRLPTSVAYQDDIQLVPLLGRNLQLELRARRNVRLDIMGQSWRRMLVIDV
eukprot:s1816_g7.t1